MEAEITRDGTITIIRLRGQLSFETTEPFKRNCLERLTDEKVVFNFQELNFVGSSGITSFIEVLTDYAARTKAKPKFCGMASEFRRLFAASALAELEIFDNQNFAVNAFKVSTETIAFSSEKLPSLDDWIED